MVKETRIVFSPHEFERFRLVCFCGGEVVCPLRDRDGKLFVAPTACPYCGDRWDSGGQSRQAHQQIKAIMDAVRYLSELPTDTPLSLRFEIDGDLEKPV